jgi:hypothetical protein
MFENTTRYLFLSSGGVAARARARETEKELQKVRIEWTGGAAFVQEEHRAEDARASARRGAPPLSRALALALSSSLSLSRHTRRQHRPDDDDDKT